MSIVRASAASNDMLMKLHILLQNSMEAIQGTSIFLVALESQLIFDMMRLRTIFCHFLCFASSFLRSRSFCSNKLGTRRPENHFWCHAALHLTSTPSQRSVFAGRAPLRTSTLRTQLAALCKKHVKLIAFQFKAIALNCHRSFDFHGSSEELRFRDARSVVLATLGQRLDRNFFLSQVGLTGQ